LTAVTEDQVVAIAGHDGVAIAAVRSYCPGCGRHTVNDHIHYDLTIFTADNDVVAVTCRNDIIAAMIRLCGDDAVDVVSILVVALQRT
jgi:hypothetical protein